MRERRIALYRGQFLEKGDEHALWRYWRASDFRGVSPVLLAVLPVAVCELVVRLALPANFAWHSITVMVALMTACVMAYRASKKSGRRLEPAPVDEVGEVAEAEFSEVVEVVAHATVCHGHDCWW